ncbi:ABC transporter ATP-binding protein [Microbacterium paludicola]|uniref:ABC-type quaternary amine transporter n=1 Tax=Microbacterium paludicola TaxID=300019 RepID=A0A4Y9FNV5_9MICO|nr:ABC transporter ATP-binding protein [Microbacterium paludicola]MBF0817538.1 ABC transporter ATP-binding protein [Microbacterium paludicola]TFU30841.1 ABC transporter ATP-binding protein [Microbacterium paludicola]
MIRFENVEVTYGDFTAIPDLDLEVAEGEFFTLLGPSGCGKTTALRALAGFVEPTRGEIYVQDRAVTRLPSDKRQVGMVFQNYALFPSMDVAENIAFGLRVNRVPRRRRDELVAEVARRVELSDEQLTRTLDQLSGGQQQRVAIARALVMQPKILLLDEPLSNLDAKLRQQLRGELKALQAEFGITTLYVTHDQDEALSMSDRIAVFNAGRIEQVGTPQEIYENSATEFVCTFVGAASKLTPALVERLGLPSAASSYLRVERPRILRPGASAGGVTVPGEVAGTRYHGTHTSCTVLADGARVQVLVRPDEGPAPVAGSRVDLAIDPAHVLQYDETGRRVAARVAEAVA